MTLPYFTAISINIYILYNREFEQKLPTGVTELPEPVSILHLHVVWRPRHQESDGGRNIISQTLSWWRRDETLWFNTIKPQLNILLLIDGFYHI